MATDVERLASSELADLLPAVQGGTRLGPGDCLRLWRTSDLTSLGVLANIARERISGGKSYFRSVVHVNPTGRLDPACPECTADAAAGRSVASPEGLLGALARVPPEARGELHLTGGADPDAGIDDLCRLLGKAAGFRPRLRLRAFTWRQLECAAAKDHHPPGRALTRLVEAGLSALAGGALVDLSPDRPHLDAESAVAAERRLPWIHAATYLNLKCELSCVFGDGDDPEFLTDVLDRIRGIQDLHGIFECFVPLSFHWPSDALELPIPTGYNHLREVAIGRLFLDNIPRIRSSPFAVSDPVAQVAQWYGADDAGSAAVAESRGPGTTPHQRDRIAGLLREAGRDPVET